MKTSKMKKVLIALDYAPTAQKVAETGFLLAKTMGAEVILLHTIIEIEYYSATYMNLGPLQMDSVVELTDKSQYFLNKIKRHLGDETIQTLVKESDVVDSILNTANELWVDVIVMGSHSRRWLEDILMGSITEKVLRHTTIPLFIVPTKKRE
jgi:nucleotide-binding universal stress UspA family protein